MPPGQCQQHPRQRREDERDAVSGEGLTEEGASGGLGLDVNKWSGQLVERHQVMWAVSFLG